MKRKWKFGKLSRDVWCDSMGHYHFFVTFNRRDHVIVSQDGLKVVAGRVVKVEYQDGGVVDYGLPKYAYNEIEEQIGFKGPEYFTVYEKDRDGNERRTDYRYHDPERFAKIVRDLYPLPF